MPRYWFCLTNGEEVLENPKGLELPGDAAALDEAVVLARVTATYPACVWLNPVPEHQWEYTMSIRMVRQVLGGRMYPLTLEGLDRAMRELVR